MKSTIRFIAFLLIALLGTSCSKRTIKFEERPTVVLFTENKSKEISDTLQIEREVLSLNPAAQFVEIPHEDAFSNIGQAAYVFNQASAERPEETLFIVTIHSPSKPTAKPLLIKTVANKFYFGPDNGIFTLILQREKLERVWVLDKIQSPASSETSSDIEIFGLAAGKLLSGVNPLDLGTPIKRSEIDFLSFPAPSISGSIISGEIWSVDSSGNMITNISSEFASRLRAGALMRISLNGKTDTGPLVKNLQEVPKGRLAVRFGSQNLLEITVNQGSAADQFKASVGMPFTIRQ